MQLMVMKKVVMTKLKKVGLVNVIWWYLGRAAKSEKSGVRDNLGYTRSEKSGVPKVKK